jgi:hypothetical protein
MPIESGDVVLNQKLIPGRRMEAFAKNGPSCCKKPLHKHFNIRTNCPLFFQPPSGRFRFLAPSFVTGPVPHNGLSAVPTRIAVGSSHQSRAHRQTIWLAWLYNPSANAPDVPMVGAGANYLVWRLHNGPRGTDKNAA